MDENEEVRVDELVKVYLRIKRAKERLDLEYKEKLDEIDSNMEVIKSALLKICKETGSEAIRTQYGTLSRRVKHRYWTDNWDEFYKFVEKEHAVELLERRIHQTNMKSWLETNTDKIPPGLNSDSEYIVTVTPTRKK